MGGDYNLTQCFHCSVSHPTPKAMFDFDLQLASMLTDAPNSFVSFQPKTHIKNM